MILFQIDAFADVPFTGNSAAVCLMTESAADDLLQNIAMEMNLSETAFVWKTGDGFQIRWMTPEIEVDLCGHATLAATWALKEAGWVSNDSQVKFHSRSGILTAEINGPAIELNFPARVAQQQPVLPDLLDCLGIANIEWFGKNEYDYLVQLSDEDAVRSCRPDFGRLSEFDIRGVIVTAIADANKDYDFVSRFFAPGCGIPEDPVTGSAHVTLSPFWAKRLSQVRLLGYQASQRGGRVGTELLGDRVKLSGTAVTIFRGEFVTDFSNFH